MTGRAQSLNPQDRMPYIDANGDMRCVTRSGALVAIPAEFKDTLQTLRCDIELALECIQVWGGVPLPVAKAILRGMDQAVAAIDLGLKSRPPAAAGKAAS